jgi:transposase
VLKPPEAAGKAAVIPPRGDRKAPRPHDKDLYRARHLIGSFFAKLRRFRATATRCDRRAVHSLGAIHLAASVIWLD